MRHRVLERLPRFERGHVRCLHGHGLLGPDVPRNAARPRLPLERAEECPWGAYRCRVWTENGVLRCERDFELRGGIVPPEQCDEVRRFTDACIESDASDIVLVEGSLAEGS